MVAEPQKPLIHAGALHRFNQLMIAFKLHISGDRLLSKTDLKELDKEANKIRAELENCRWEMKLKY